MGKRLFRAVVTLSVSLGTLVFVATGYAVDYVPIDLTAAGYTFTPAPRGMGDGQVVAVGAVAGVGDGHAVLFNAPLISGFVDLNPPGAILSGARGVAGSQQVGFAAVGGDATWHAALWTGTAASFVDLGLGRSVANATDGSAQVGYRVLTIDAEPTGRSSTGQ